MMYGEGSERKRLRVRDICCFLFAGAFILIVGLVGGILIGIYAYHGGPGDNNNKLECVIKMEDLQNGGQTMTTSTTAPSNDTTMNQECPRRNPFIPHTGPEIFAPLTSEEIQRIKSFMIEQDLATDGESTIQSNYITAVDIRIPNKTDVLHHLDQGGPFPGRFSKVTVVRGNRTVPDLMVYEVGPLNEDVLTVTKLHTDGDIVFEARVIDSVEIIEYNKLLSPVSATLEDLVQESFDGTSFSNGFLSWWPYNGPPGPYEKQRETRLNAFFSPLGGYNPLDMLPLSVSIHCPGNDPKAWYVHSLYYLNQGPYDSAQDLMEAYRNNTIRKVRLPKDYRDTINSHLNLRRDETRPLRRHSDMASPTTYEPEGPRYDIRGHHVSWMGWEFYVSSRTMRGPALFDIKYKGERITYELSMNEISLLYASDSKDKSNAVFIDALVGIGMYGDILKTVDCPAHASVLNTAYYEANSGIPVSGNSICIFEADEEGASWRHKDFGFAGGLRRTNLIVRFSTTIGNYDYITDFQFRLDGKLFTKVKASGFIQTHFWDKDNPNRENNPDDSKVGRDPFGFRVGDFAHGLIHDHMFGFKVDMDVLGSNNSFEVIHWKSGSSVDAFKTQDPSVTEKPDYFLYNMTRYLQYETIEAETGFRLNAEEPIFWTVVNENFRNRWGVKRGYQIAPLQTALQNMGAQHPAFPAFSFSKYTCAVTKYKPSERFIDSYFDAYRLDNPRGELENIIDNEQIRNEDIVNWVSVGFLHVPTSEDFPMTIALDTGFVLKPFNFFDTTDVYDMPSYHKRGEEEELQSMAEPCLEPAV